MDKKYRILYNEQRVVDVLEDYGTTFLGAGTGLMVLVDTKENAKVMLDVIGVDTNRLYNKNYMIEPTPLTGIDYLENINSSVDPDNLTDGLI